jgi:hypothetical protein
LFGVLRLRPGAEAPAEVRQRRPLVVDGRGVLHTADQHDVIACLDLTFDAALGPSEDVLV